MVPATLGKYQLGPLLGQGGMGAVYRSFHPQLNRAVAIKVILNTTADPQAQQRFMREAQLVANLSHPNIIRIFDVDVQDSQPYIVMDLVEGTSLLNRLAAGPLPLRTALQIMIPLAEALDYAHKQGIIHRDLKPANVLLRADGSPVLADFGIARATHVEPAQQLTATNALLGTLPYMAPEQFTGGGTDVRSDIYALGVLLFEMLAGQRPFGGDNGQILVGHLQQLPPPLSQFVPTLPAEIGQLVARMLAKTPADRPQSAADVAFELRAAQDRGAVTGATVMLQQPVVFQATSQLPATPAPTLAVTPPLAPPTTATSDPPRQSRAPSRMILLGGIAAIVALVAISAQVIGLLRAPTNTPDSIVVPRIDVPTMVVPRIDVPTIAPRVPTSENEPQPSPAATAAAPTVVLSFAASSPPPSIGDASLRRVTDATLKEPQLVGPEQFSVGNMSYVVAANSIWVFGEFRNDGDAPRENVKIRVTLLDAADGELASEEGFSKLSYLKPGEIGPFLVLFTDKGDLLPQVARYTLEVRSSKGDFQLGYSFHDLEVADDPKQDQDFNGLSLSGQLRNTGSQPLKFPQIHAVFYDNDGRVVGLSQTFAETASDDKILPAGEEARFDLQWSIFAGVPTSYRLFAEGSAP